MNINLDELVTYLDKLTIDEIAELIPGWLQLNNIEDFGLIYMSPSMERDFALTIKIMEEKYGKHYLNSFIHPETTKRVIPLLMYLVKQKSYNKTISFFQYIKTPKTDYSWYYTSLKLLKNFDCTIAITNPVKDFKDFNNELEVLLNENIYLKKNLDKFNKLTQREKEVIKLVVKGNSNIDIATSFNVSELTIKTHRQNIYKKLEINHVCDLVQFANSFGIK